MADFKLKKVNSLPSTLAENAEIIFEGQTYIGNSSNEPVLTNKKYVDDKASLYGVNVEGFGAKGDGITDDSTAIQNAINSIDRGTIILAPNKTYIAKGIIPKNDITINLNGSTLQLPQLSENHLFAYNSDTMLSRFSICNGSLDGVDESANGINVIQPNPLAPTKTWRFGVIDNVEIKNFNIGIYCQIPGSVGIRNCHIHNNDIGIAWDREHFYITNTFVETGRIGIRSTGNHFSIFNLILAYCSKGWTTQGAGLGIYTDVAESVFSSVNVIGCPIGMEGPFGNCRFADLRFAEPNIDICISNISGCNINNSIFRVEGATGIKDLTGANIISNCTFNRSEYGIHQSSGDMSETIIQGCRFSYISKHDIFLDVTTSNWGLVFSGNSFFNNGEKAAIDTYSFIKINVNCLVRASVFNGNKFRNLGAGNSKSAIDASGASATDWQDVLISGNVARNMTNTPYDVPVGTVFGTNVPST